MDTMPTRRTAAPTFPIRAVARLTGLSVDTLRAWERRHAAVVPARGQRGRVYSQTDVARLRQLAELVGRGHAIGTIAGAPNAQLARLLAGSSARPARPEPTPADADLETLTSALERYDFGLIERTINRAAALLRPADLVFTLVLPLLQEVGRRWESGQLRPSQEHLVSAVIRGMLSERLHALARVDAAPSIVFATLAGERHELGLLSAAVLAAADGWGVIYLGVDLPAADVVHAVISSGAQAVVLAATTPVDASSREMRQLLRLPADVQIWSGGPAASQLQAAAGRRMQILADLGHVSARLSGLQVPARAADPAS
jgi:MerR family transcriptional regulator, light-induced transcriptional regulator